MKKTIKSFLFLFCLLGALSSYADDLESCQDAKCVDYFKQFKKYARAGHASALATLGEFYYYGYGTDKDIHLALQKFKRAAKYGSVYGQNRAGVLLLSVPELKDTDKGIKYLKKAARNRHGDSAYLLGIIYASKDFGYYDSLESDEWMMKAHSLGHSKVRGFIADMSQSKNFNTSNYPQLFELIEELYVEQGISNKEATDQVASLNKKSLNVIWPEENEHEVLTVTAPLQTISQLFDYKLASMKNTFPDKYQIGTGSRIRGQTCEKNVSCIGSSEGKEFMHTLRTKLWAQAQ